ncbi:MAG: outer membrane lipoprotein carrier protein LolA [Gammaproteobacteria bacterium]|nr:MAG: outer membrane lipoprotein carrier protein LolA [Gammaproteobacteria bacterium]
MNKIIKTMLAITVMSASFTLSAAESATDKLNEFVKTVVTFQAKFNQTVIGPRGIVLEEAEGFFILDRPGRFRWDYKQPYPQYIVADGEKIWFYDVDLEQVTVKSQLEALADTPASLLSGDMLPEDNYLLRDLPSEDGLLWVELIPKNIESNFQTITLAFDSAGVLNQMIMKDSFDQKTRLAFTQVTNNPQLADDVFVFTPPKGVDIVGDIGQ